MKSLLSALCTLLLLQAAAAAETHGDEGGAEETVTKTVSPCGIPLEDLYSAIEGIFGQNYTVYINCLSFDETGSLERGVVSGTHPTEADQRFVLECQTGILVAICSTLPANEMDIRDNYAACSMCVDSLVSMEICVNRCSANCERCYDNGTKCSRCTACTPVTNKAEACKVSPTLDMYCSAECPSGTTINHEQNNYCECTGVKNLVSYEPSPIIDPEEEKHEEIHCPTEEPPFTCGVQCTDPGHLPNNESGICFACGLEYCVRCNIIDRPNECLRCRIDTVLYEHECISCPLAPFAIEAILQEHEVEEEEKQNTYRTIELAVVLPILSVLIIVFFVSMSIFAHHRYPHIAAHGRKRHRRAPSPDPTVSGQEDLQESHVWRARPTISLR